MDRHGRNAQDPMDEIQLRSNTKVTRAGRNTNTSLLVATDMHATETLSEGLGEGLGEALGEALNQQCLTLCFTLPRITEHELNLTWSDT